ncbi:alpha-glucosidase [Thermoflexales bacterium]|nr:alpha-glucosidase [Thermoflexales bacterium]
MPILTYSVQIHELTIQTDCGYLALTPYTPRAIRVRYSLKPEFSAKASLIVTAQPDLGIQFRVQETPDRLLFATSEVVIAIDRQTVAFTYSDRHGNLLTKEPDCGGKTLEPIDVLVSVFDQSTTIESRATADGVRVDAENVRKVVDRQAYHTKLEFEWARGEALYGLGSHEEGMFNLRGQHQYLYQQNMKAVVPVLLSTRGYGIFLDSCSLMTFHDDAFGSYLWSDVDDELDYYFVYGPEFDQIIHELRSLTGQAPLLPKWAYGYLQSKERYTSQSELLEVVKEYRARELPLDGIVLDWKSWTGDLWGQKSLDPDRFPNPDQMTADLHALHAHLMVSIWPIMKPGGDNWQELHDHGFLLGNQANYDAFNPAARACYWQQANRGLFAHGIDAWWCDCSEPFEADWKGAIKPEPEERLRINTEEAKRYLDPEVINVYSLLHSEGIYQGQRKVTEAKRVVNLTRSAYLGQQRYATITWSGDVVATWETLRKQIADGLNFCVTGVPYWTTDIGAFFVGRKPDLWFWSGDYDAGVDDLGYRELYVRWFQFGAFLPMFRAHGTDTSREIWRFGEPGDLMYDALAKVLQLRYRLLPYIYSSAGWTTHQAYTMLRALPFDFRHDPAVYDVADQFMFGPAFLVNPVTQPMYYTRGSVPLADARKARSVYLPAGTEWYDFWTDQRYQGGQTSEACATLDVLPLYVRAGSIVPMGPRRQHVDDQPDAPIELHVYPGRDSCFLLYEDEGDSYRYEQGAFATIQIEWDNAARRLTLGQRAGQYPGMSEQREFRVVVHDVKLDGRRVNYDGQPISVDL